MNFYSYLYDSVEYICAYYIVTAKNILLSKRRSVEYLWMVVYVLFTVVDDFMFEDGTKTFDNYLHVLSPHRFRWFSNILWKTTFSSIFPISITPARSFEFPRHPWKYFSRFYSDVHRTPFKFGLGLSMSMHEPRRVYMYLTFRFVNAGR